HTHTHTLTHIMCWLFSSLPFSEATANVMFLVCKSNTCLPSVGAQTFCPIELSPSTVVVKYGDPVSINCSTSDSLVETMGWEVSQGGTGMQSVNHLTWTLERLTEWTIEPSCFINLLPGGATEQCDKKAKVVLYSKYCEVSNSPSDGATFVLNENKTYNFSCNVKQVAPVQNLTVRWYKGDTLIYTDTFKDPNRKPVNQSSFLNFTMTRRDNGVTLRCEAHMDLEPEGPRLHVSSQEYDITVQCKYFICRLISIVLVSSLLFILLCTLVPCKTNAKTITINVPCRVSCF
uniref:Ig-like domain-containing protein n=1 Tax=Anabas testudineus TaxID=64144 RepID=A0A3Q1JC78_ANATE